MATQKIDGIAFAHETLTITTTVKSLTATVYAPTTNGVALQPFANRVIISVENGTCRYLTTGDNPSATSGHLVGHGAFFDLTGLQNIKNFRIRAVAGNGIIQATYERVL